MSTNVKTGRVASFLLQRIFSLDHPYQEKNDCCDEENVNKPPDGVYANHAEEPKDEKNDGNSDKHGYFN